MAKRNTKKDPLHIDNIIAMCKKEGMNGTADRLRELKWANKELKKLRAGDVITFEELPNLPKDYKHICRTNKDDEEYLIEVEELSDLQIKDGEASWSNSNGDPDIEMGTGPIRDIPHSGNDEYTYTLYHILPKEKKKIINRKLKSHPLEKKSVMKKIENVIKKNK